MCVVARQDLCCGKTRSLLWQDIREVALRTASTKGCGAKRCFSSGGGISAIWLAPLVRSVHSCAMLAKTVPFRQTKVLCPTAVSGVFLFSGPEWSFFNNAEFSVYLIAKNTILVANKQPGCYFGYGNKKSL